MECLHELITIQTLINGVHNYTFMEIIISSFKS
jgi:hypothetical protein